MSGDAALLAILLGVAVVCLLCSWAHGSMRRGRAFRRLTRVVRGEADLGPREGDLWLAARRLGRSGLRQAGGHVDVGITRLLLQSGWRGPEMSAMFAGARLVLTALAVGAAYAATSLGAPAFSLSTAKLWMLCIASGSAAYLAPKLLLARWARSRMLRMNDDVTTCAQILRVLFDAGLSLEQALRALVRDGHSLLPILRREIEFAIGSSSADQESLHAFHALAEELRLPDLDDLVRLLGQIDRYGGSAQPALARFSERLDDRQRIDLQERVGKLSVVLPLILFAILLPALMLFVSGPGFAALLHALERAQG